MDILPVPRPQRGCGGGRDWEPAPCLTDLRRHREKRKNSKIPWGRGRVSRRPFPFTSCLPFFCCSSFAQDSAPAPARAPTCPPPSARASTPAESSRGGACSSRTLGRRAAPAAFGSFSRDISRPNRPTPCCRSFNPPAAAANGKAAPGRAGIGPTSRFLPSRRTRNIGST